MLVIRMNLKTLGLVVFLFMYYRRNERGKQPIGKLGLLQT